MTNIEPENDLVRPLVLEEESELDTANARAMERFVAGTDAMRAGNHRHAIDAFREVLEVAPNFFEAHINLGNVLYAQTRYEQALQHYRAAVRLQPKHFGGHYNLANTLTKLELYEQAVEALERALAIEPDHGPSRCNLEYLQTKMGLTGKYGHYDPGQELPTKLYFKELFDVRTEDHARSVILTPERGISTEERWQRETPYISDLIQSTLSPRKTSIMLDFGCGIGRLSREVILRNRCSVIGVDISSSMRRLSIPYVRQTNWISVSPTLFDRLIESEPLIDLAYSVWVLQHCLDPQQEIARIHRALKPGARLFVLNTNTRCIPTKRGWIRDKVDVRSLLREQFAEECEVALEKDGLTSEMIEHSFCGVYRK